MAGLALVALASYQKDLVNARQLDALASLARNMRATLDGEALNFADLLIRQEALLETGYLSLDAQLQQELFPALLKADLLPSEREQLMLVANQYQRLTQFYAQAATQAKGDDYIAANITWATQIKPILDGILTRATSLSDALTVRANTSVKQADTNVAQRQQLTLLALLATLTLSILTARITIRAIVTQNKRLKQTFSELQLAHNEVETRQQTSEAVGHHVSKLASELKTTAAQQANGSLEQVGIVNEVNASITQLSTAAENIAELVIQVNTAANLVADDSQHIEEITTLVVKRSEIGMKAVSSTITASQEVADSYQHLLEVMNDLNSKHINMRRVLDLLRSVAGETHLLSLNASIEAAGAGQYGERFAVIAQQVKNLAARSSEASHEVLNIVQEIENSTTSMVNTVQATYQKTLEMTQITGQAGEVIEGMREVSTQSQHQSRLIKQAAQEVRTLSEVINGATSQQRIASQHVLEALAGLSVVAQQNASGSSMVSITAKNLDEVSRTLNITLVPI
jgi:methyl-accepting chemotaxis protein